MTDVYIFQSSWELTEISAKMENIWNVLFIFVKMIFYFKKSKKRSKNYIFSAALLKFHFLSFNRGHWAIKSYNSDHLKKFKKTKKIAIENLLCQGSVSQTPKNWAAQNRSDVIGCSSLSRDRF